MYSVVNVKEITMTFGDLKALVENFEALGENVQLVIHHPDTGRLVDFHLHDVSVVGRDDKHKQTAITGCKEKVMLCYVSYD
jgi:hypothetical protein